MLATQRPCKCEDLIQKPVETLYEIFEFAVGARLDRQVLHEQLRNLQGGATNDKAERYDGVSTKPLFRWVEGLKPEQVTLIENITGSASQRLGYDVTSRSLGSLRALAMVPGIASRMSLAARLVSSQFGLRRTN